MYIDKIFKGEMHRYDYFMATLFTFVGKIVSIFIIISGVNPTELATFKHIVAALAVMGMVILIYLDAGVIARRHRSIGLNPWFTWIAFVPPINFIYGIFLCLAPKDSFKN